MSIIGTVISAPAIAIVVTILIQAVTLSGAVVVIIVKLWQIRPDPLWSPGISSYPVVAAHGQSVQKIILLLGVDCHHTLYSWWWYNDVNTRSLGKVSWYVMMVVDWTGANYKLSQDNDQLNTVFYKADSSSSATVNLNWNSTIQLLLTDG